MPSMTLIHLEWHLLVRPQATDHYFASTLLTFLYAVYHIYDLLFILPIFQHFT